MTKLFAALIAGLIATSSFAASHVGAPMAAGTPNEAMKAGDAKAEAAAQAKVDARKDAATDTMPKGHMAAMQPEAMKPHSEKAEAKAEMKKRRKAKIGKKNSTDVQMKRDAAKL
jgi:hypothetical protein